jgi:hypothetical protein
MRYATSARHRAVRLRPVRLDAASGLSGADTTPIFGATASALTHAAPVAKNPANRASVSINRLAYLEVKWSASAAGGLVAGLLVAPSHRFAGAIGGMIAGPFALLAVLFYVHGRRVVYRAEAIIVALIACLPGIAAYFVLRLITDAIFPPRSSDVGDPDDDFDDRPRRRRRHRRDDDWDE